jgi:rhamnulokinase
MRRHYVAIDLGAESGRAMRGRLHNGVLELAELHRFPNEPVRKDGSVRWDILRLWLEIQRGLELASHESLESVGVDAWGCDYALIGERGDLLENPYHYRDMRTDGIMEAVCNRIGRERIYSITGVQFLPFNTLYQLSAACRLTPRLVAAASAAVTIPDLLNYWLTGRVTSEFTIATTTQCIDAGSRTWATQLLLEADIPTHLLAPLVEPGSIVGALKPDACPGLAGTPVVAPACHDTGSAVAAVSTGGDRAFISSGTWSLLGTELPRPVITPEARDGNFTNEGGVCGSTRFLKNIGGLWLLQSGRRTWAASGLDVGYDALLAAASDTPSFNSLFDPDHHAFLHPIDMVRTIAEYCRQTRQPEPAGPAAYSRAILESLAMKYRVVLESLEALTGADRTTVRGDSNRGRRREEPAVESVHGRCDGARRCRGPRGGNGSRQHCHADARDRRRELPRGGESSHRPIVSGGALRASRCRRVGSPVPTVSGVRGVDLCLTSRSSGS